MHTTTFLVTEIDPGVSPSSTWPIFTWIAQQVGNFQTLGVVTMVALLVGGILVWVAGSGSDNSRQQTSGKWMVGLSILGAVVIGAAPALIQWASGQNPIADPAAIMGLIGDWLSDGFNDILKGLILGMAAFVGDIINMIFTIDSRTSDGRPTDVDLQAATSIGNLVLVLALPLTIAAVICQIMRSTAQGRAQGVLRALVGGVAMVAATRIVFWYAPELVRGFDETTILLLDAFDAGPGGIGTTLMQGVGLQKVDGEWRSTDGSEYEVPGWMTFSAAAGNPLGVPLILWLLMGLGALMLMLMLAFRRWALVAMIAVVPLAVMFLPAEKASKNIIGTWVKVFISLVAAKPLAAIILSISAKMLSVSGQMNLVMFIAAFVGLLAAALAPLIAMQFFNFLGAEVADGYARAAGEGAAKQGAQKVHRGGQMLASAGRSMGASGRRTPTPVPNRTPGNGSSGGGQGKPSAVPNRPVGQLPSPGQPGRPPQGGRPPGSGGSEGRPTPAPGAGSGAAAQPRPVQQQRN